MRGKNIKKRLSFAAFYLLWVVGVFSLGLSTSPIASSQNVNVDANVPKFLILTVTPNAIDYGLVEREAPLGSALNFTVQTNTNAQLLTLMGQLISTQGGTVPLQLSANSVDPNIIIDPPFGALTTVTTSPANLAVVNGPLNSNFNGNITVTTAASSAGGVYNGRLDFNAVFI